MRYHVLVSIRAAPWAEIGLNFHACTLDTYASRPQNGHCVTVLCAFRSPGQRTDGAAGRNPTADSERRRSTGAGPDVPLPLPRPAPPANRRNR